MPRLVRGTWLEAIGIEPRRPLGCLRDTAAIVRALLAGDDCGVFRGRVPLRSLLRR